MAENIREIVLDTLLEMERSGQYSNLLIRSVLDKYNYLDVKDKAFFKRESRRGRSRDSRSWIITWTVFLQFP